jgi:type IV fimbrial biogenesis protein FimT
MTTRNRHRKGLTLPELLIGLAVFSTLAVGTTELLPRLIQRNRMATEVNHFMTALHLARSEAILHGSRVVLCPSGNGMDCGNGSEWIKGWLLFASDDREHDSDEILLQAGNPLEAGIRMTTSNHRKRIVFRQDGSSGGSNSSFTFCDSRGLAEPRVICLSNAGRPRLTPTRCDGQPIVCL